MHNDHGGVSDPAGLSAFHKKVAFAEPGCGQDSEPLQAEEKKEGEKKGGVFSRFIDWLLR